MKTRTMILSCLLMICFCSLQCDYTGQYSDFFLYRQPSARAEALGRSLVAINGDIFSYYYNPAGNARLPIFNFGLVHSSPANLINKSEFLNLAVSTHITGIGTFTLGRINLDYNQKASDSPNSFEETYIPQYTLYTLGLSRETIPGLYAGLNVNLFQADLAVKDRIYYSDLGIIYQMKFSSDHRYKHNLNLATSLINLNQARIERDNSSWELPAVWRLGTAYELHWLKNPSWKRLSGVDILVSAEYFDLLNSKDYTALHLGTEFTFLEVLSLRCGFYRSDIPDSPENKEYLEEITYGLGLSLPLHKLGCTAKPVIIKVDYVNLDQPVGVIGMSPRKFHTVGIQVQLGEF
ncbi:MAG: hypothetical protein JW784_00350 [Candidatus Cloacimonetes bacterium]|nr:hypothetical protein [Candidatus Cloacimonadota bacterium]